MPGGMKAESSHKKNPDKDKPLSSHCFFLSLKREACIQGVNIRGKNGNYWSPLDGHNEIIYER
jgi:hypothetical protein